MTAPKRWKKVLPAVAIAASMSLFAACSSGASGDKGQSGAAEGGKTGPTLTIFAGTQTPIVSNFNPYSPTLLPGTLGSIYEPLFYYNKAQADEPVALIGEKAEWADDGMSLDIDLRKDIKWNDGEDLTAEDVVYSFTNEAVIMDYVEKAEVVDDHKVRLTFNTPSFTNEYSLLGATYIVPEHVFSDLDDMVTFANDEAPVGSGPFMLDKFTDASYTMKKNDNYWDKDRPGIDAIQYLGIDGNSSAESLFQAGQLDYSTMFVPNPDTLTSTGLGYILVQSPNIVAVLTCSNAELGCEGAQTDSTIRKAFNVAIDRSEINEKAFYGFAQNAAPTFTKPNRDEQWIAEGMPTSVPETGDVEAAKTIMEEGGYTLGSDGIYEKDGQRAAFELVSVEGWSDNNAAGELMEAQAKLAGIEAKHVTVTLDEFTDMRLTGKYQMAISALFGTSISDPYTIYRDSFTTDFTTPVGTPLAAKQLNYARYSNPIVDAAVATAGETNDKEVKKEAYAQIQEQIIEDMPYIPMFHGGSQTFYNQTDFEGWPTEKDLYAFPASWDGISSAYVMSKLTYKK